MPDMVNHPPHYTQGGIECIDAIRAACEGRDAYEGYLTGQGIKYIWRYPFKNGLEDLRKAEFYLRRLIEEREEALHKFQELAYDIARAAYLEEEADET